MSEFKQNLKDLINKGIDSIGNTASTLAANTRQKMNEISIRARINEILVAFGEKAYEAWKNGAEMPEELAADLREVQELETELNRPGAAADDAGAPEETETTSENEAAVAPEEPDHADIPTIDVPREEEKTANATPLSDAIDQLFSNSPQMDQMADKINTSLDEMGKQLLQFSSDFGKKLSDMADDLMNDSDRKDG